MVPLAAASLAAIALAVLFRPPTSGPGVLAKGAPPAH
jgi:hypothetical protein